MSEKRAFFRGWADAKHVSVKRRNEWIAEMIAEIERGETRWTTRRTGDAYLVANMDEMGCIEIGDYRPIRTAYFHPSFEKVVDLKTVVQK